MRGLSLACAAACVLATLATAASAGGIAVRAFAPPHGGVAPHGGPLAFGPHGAPGYLGPVRHNAPAPGFAYRAPTAEGRFDHGGGFFFSRTFGGEGFPQRNGYARNLRYGHGYGDAYGFGYGHRGDRPYGYGSGYGNTGAGYGSGLGFTGADYGYGYTGGEAATGEVSTGPLILLAPNFEAFAGPAASASGGPRIIFVNRDRKAAAAGEKLPQVMYGDASNPSIGGPKIIYGDSWN